VAKVSEKYIAGFLDSDGSIQVLWRPLDRKDTNPALRRAYLSLEWSQRTDRDEVLQAIRNFAGGRLSYRTIRGVQYTTLKISGKKAEMLLSRIKKYLVNRKHYAEVVLDILRQPVNMEVAKEFLKAHRLAKVDPKVNYPTRKWLAGYFDGDGTIDARMTRSGAAQIVASISCMECHSYGIETIQKNFGGSIKRWTSGNGVQLATWTMTMPPSKVEKFFGYFGKHSIVKRPQIDFVLSRARMGHFREGEYIRAELKRLKAQPHRLSEPGGVTPSCDSRSCLTTV